MDRNYKRSKVQDQFQKAWDDNNHIGIGLLPTGLGKSKIIADAINKVYQDVKDFDIPVLIGVPSAELRDKGLPAELKKWNVEHEVEIQCYRTLAKYKNKQIGLFVADEFDDSLTPGTLNFYRSNKASKFLALSASLSLEKEEIALSITDIIFRLSLNEAQRRGIINKTKIFLHLLPIKNNYWYKNIQNQIDGLNENIRRLRKFKGDTTALENKKDWLTHNMGNKFNRKLTIWNDESLITYAKDLTRKILLKDENSKIIYFSEFTKYLDELCPYTYYGAKPKFDIEKFNDGSVRRLGVTTKKVGRGISFNELNHSIGHSFTSSSTSFMQSLQGRMTRLDPSQTAYIHVLGNVFEDNGYRLCQNVHWFLNLVEELRAKDDCSPIKVYGPNILKNLKRFDKELIDEL